MNKYALALFLLLPCLGAKPGKRTWLALGDSITYLNDHKDETGNRITKGYLTLMKEKHPELEYINQGHNGWTAGQIAERIASLGLAKAEVYTVFLGTNDWWQGHALGRMSDYENNTGIQTIYGSFRIIIDYLRKLNPNARIILLTPMQRGDFVYINNYKNNAFGSYKPKNGQTLEEIANGISVIGKRAGCPVVDLYHDKELTLERMVKFKRVRDPKTGDYRNYRYPAYINIPFDPASDEYPYPEAAIDLTYDGLHPSDAGYEIITRRLARKW
ncbi:MAG: SGNH/GDSL hydrolase family protein [Siphonobacter sp.]